MKKALHPILYSGLLLLTMKSATMAQGVLNASIAPDVGKSVNLTTEGVIDWSHWGINGLTQDHKAVNGTPVGLISDETLIGASYSGAFGDNFLSYSWSDGTPTVSATSSTTGIYEGNGAFQFTVLADTTSRTLRVYVGGVSSSTTLTATLSDNSAPAYSDSTLTSAADVTFAPDANHFDGVYTITYKAASANQTLTINYAQTATTGNITLQAATLFPTPTAPPAAPTNLTATAGNNRVGLQWTASAGADSYNVKRSGAANGVFTTIGTSTTGNYQDFTAVNGTTYYYEVTAVNLIGEGAASNIVSATPQTGSDGTGLTGKYYLNGTGSQTANTPGSANFTFGVTPNLVELDATVNFTGGNNGSIGTANAWPAAAQAMPNNFSAQWTGAIKIPATGAYVFATNSDDGSGVYLDGSLVVNNFFYQGPTLRSSSGINLTAGSVHTLRAPFFQGTGGYTMQLFWTPPGQSLQIIPTFVLFPDATQFAPPAPTLTALPGAQSVTLSYSQPDNATSFNILRSLKSGGPYTTIKTGVTTKTYKDTGLTNGTTYYYVVQAVNFKGTSPNSNEVAIAPIAPIIGNGIGLAGTYYADPNTTTETNFSLAEATTPILFDIVPVINFTAGNAAAYNATTFPDGTPKNNFTAVWTGQVLAPYTGAYQFQTISDDGSQLSLDTGSGYQIIVSNDLYQGPTAVTSASINLVAGTKYNIKMEYFQGGGGETAQLLYNPLGSGLVIIPQTQLFPNFTAAPAAPTNLFATGGDALVSLGWTSSQGAITYNVLRSTTSGGSYTTVATGISGVGYTDTTVTNGTTYYYVVVAVNNIGTSVNSNEASATPALPALTLHYTFENGPTGANPDPITDVTNNGNTGMLFGGDANFTHDAAQGVWAGMSVDAANYIALPNALDLGNQFTFFTYVKFASDSAGGTIRPIFATAQAGGAVGGFALYVNNYDDNTSHDLVVETNTGNSYPGGNIQTKTTSPNGVFQFDGQYHAVAAVVNRSAGVVSLYYDGVQVLANGVIDTHWPSMTGDNRLGEFAGGTIIAPNTEFDDVRLYGGLLNAADIAAISGMKLTGHIALEGILDLSATNPNAPLGFFDIQIRAHGSLTPLYENKTVTLTTAVGSANGTYTLTGVPAGTYDVWIKGSKNLATLVPNVVISGLATMAPDVLLLAGDTDNNNAVDPTDFGIFVGAYNTDSAVVNGGYDPRADFNFDGIVDPTDFGLFVGNYNSAGAP